MRLAQFRLALHLLPLFLVARLALGAAPAAPSFSENQKVEVREGDTWSAATIVKKEGRRFLIRYEGADAANDEWVGSDRIRVAGAGGEAAAPAAEAAVKAPAARPVVWQSGQKVQVKWGGTWYDAVISNKRGEWYLITYAREKTREWVEPWRIRAVGSTEDKVGHAAPNPSIAAGRAVPPPPAPTPRPAPRPIGVAGAQAAEEAAKAFAEDPAFKAADASGARPLDLTPPADGYSVPVDPAKPAAKPAARSIALRGGNGTILDAPTAVFIPREQPGQALVGYVDKQGNSPSRIEKVDLAAGRSVAVLPLAQETVVRDISPDGKLALVGSSEIGSGKNDRLEVWSLEGAKPQRTRIFFPYNDKQWHARDVAQALFIDPAHVLSISSAGLMALWNIDSAKAVWSVETDRYAVPRLSPGGKYLAISLYQRIVFLDALQGRVLAQVPYDRSWGELAFSPSGKQLVAFSSGATVVWDVSTGSVVRQFEVRVPGSAIAMPADNYALLDGTTLIDVERRIPLWKYEISHGVGSVAANGQFWYVSRANPMSQPRLASYEIPHAQALAAAKALNPEELLLLKPGVKVALANNVSADEALRQEITAGLKAQIQAAGLVHDDAASIRIVASTATGRTEERSYRRMGESAFSGGQKITITEQISKLVIELEGKAIWQTQTSVMPSSILTLKQGQSMEQAVAEASKPNYEFFKTAKLPTHLTKPRSPEWFGSSPLP